MVSLFLTARDRVSNVRRMIGRTVGQEWRLYDVGGTRSSVSCRPFPSRHVFLQFSDLIVLLASAPPGIPILTMVSCVFPQHMVSS